VIVLVLPARADIAVPRPPLRGEVPHDLPPPGPPPAGPPWPWIGAVVVMVAIGALIAREMRHRT